MICPQTVLRSWLLWPMLCTTEVWYTVVHSGTPLVGLVAPRCQLAIITLLILASQDKVGTSPKYPSLCSATLTCWWLGLMPPHYHITITSSQDKVETAQQYPENLAADSPPADRCWWLQSMHQLYWILTPVPQNYCCSDNTFSPEF